MTRRILNILFVFCLAHPLQGQQDAEYAQLPRAYAIPSWDLDMPDLTERESEPWWVYADRDRVKVYADRTLEEQIGTVSFMEAFVVWEESENALRLVGKADPNGVFIYGRVFDENAVDKGWVRKSDLILGQQALHKERVLMKAVLLHSPGGVAGNPDKPTREIEIPEGEFRIYNILKKDSEGYLLMGTRILHNQVSRDNAFWVPLEAVHLLDESAAYVPRWKDIEQGKVVSAYKSSMGASNRDSNDELIEVREANPYLGFMEARQLDDHTVLGFSPQRDMSKAYLNSNSPILQKAYLMDYNQFVLFKELVKILSDAKIAGPIELESELGHLFSDYGIDAKDIKTLSLAELLSRAGGFAFDDLSGKRRLPISKMGITGRRKVMVEYSSTRAKLDNWEELVPLSFNSEIEYFWVPEDWIMPERLHELALEVNLGERELESYDHFEVYYINGSSIENMDGDAYELLYEDLKTQMRNAAEQADMEEGKGIFAFYSNGMATIKNDNEVPASTTVDNILVSLRKGSFYPDKNRDKLNIETELFTKYLERIEGKLVVNYVMPQSFFSEDLWERGYMTMNLPERLYSLTMPKDKASLEVRISLYAITDPEQLDVDIMFIEDNYAKNNHVEYTFLKY